MAGFFITSSGTNVSLWQWVMRLKVPVTVSILHSQLKCSEQISFFISFVQCFWQHITPLLCNLILRMLISVVLNDTLSEISRTTQQTTAMLHCIVTYCFIWFSECNVSRTKRFSDVVCLVFLWLLFGIQICLITQKHTVYVYVFWPSLVIIFFINCITAICYCLGS